METLILTQSYLPHRIVGWQKAVTMSFIGKVEVVESYDEVIRSPSQAMPMPAVVRLTRAIRHRQPKVRFSRTHVLVRDRYTCQYCGEPLPARELTFDHVVPRSQGGRTSWENIVAACRPCNSAKRDRTPEQAGMTLRSKPVRPAPVPFQLAHLRVARTVPDAWKGWVLWGTSTSTSAS